MPHPGIVICLLLGVISTIVGSYKYFQTRASSSWPFVAGRILESSIKIRTYQDVRKSYQAQVSYEYKVHGERHIGYRITFGEQGTLDRDREQEIVDRYKAGTEVNVYYDPDDPRESVLEQRVGNETATLLVIGIISTLVGLMFLLNS